MEESLNWYTGGNFDRFNEKLRKGMSLDETEKMHLANIDMSFQLAPRLGRPIKVYKGKSSRNVYSDKAFVSTSTSFEEALNFTGNGCCVMEITVPQGTKVLDLSSQSRYKEEREILLDRDGTMTLTDTKVVNDMVILYCSYTKGLELDNTTMEEVKEVIGEERIIENVLDQLVEELELYDTPEEGVLEIHRSIYPGIPINPRIVSKILEKLKNL